MATIRRRKAEDGTLTLRGPSARQLARWTLHVLSAYATYLFVAGIAPEGANGYVTLATGLLLELVLYKSKALLWERGSDMWGLSCLVFDGLTNAGGIWPALLRLDNTSMWRMWVVSFGLGDGMHELPALVLALVMGFLLAIAPHAMRDE